MAVACDRQIAAYRGPQQREENVVIGPAPARSHDRTGVRRSAGGSPPARRKRAADEADGSDESLLSEGASVENAWPRAQPADGGRAHIDHGLGNGNGNGNG